MNKTDLAAQVAEKAGLNRQDAAKAVDAVFDVITDSLAQGDKVTLIGFGTFQVAKREAREGNKPGTKEKITIPASKVARFTAGKGLKDRVNGDGAGE